MTIYTSDLHFPAVSESQPIQKQKQEFNLTQNSIFNREIKQRNL